MEVEEEESVSGIVSTKIKEILVALLGNIFIHKNLIVAYIKIFIYH